MKRTTIYLHESWQCRTILTQAQVTKSLLSLRDDFWVNPKNVKVESALSRIKNPTAIVRFTESLKRKRKVLTGRREVGKYTSHMFSVNINPTECQKPKARKGDAAYFEISTESVLIWWLPSWKAASAYACIQWTPAVTQNQNRLISSSLNLSERGARRLTSD